MSDSSEEEHVVTQDKKKNKRRNIDDEFEEEDEDETLQSKRRKRLGNYILDEAVVDEDDDDEEYDYDDENDLIDHPDDEAEVQDAIQHLQYDNRRELNNIDFQNDEEIEEYYRNRYEETDNDDFGAGDQMASAISQQKCLPGVKDPNLWQVSCTRGEEKNAVLTLMNKYMFTQYTSTPMLIKSAFSKDNVSGFIYIESFKETHVKKAISDIRHLSRGTNSLKMVSIAEMTDVMKVLKSFKKLAAGQWVRITQGLYKGDLARVVEVEDAQNKIFVQLIPRIDVKRIKEGANANKAKGRWIRPPQDLLTRRKITDLGLDYSKSGDRIIVRSQEFDERGFLYKLFKLTQVQSERVNPEMHELERFNETPGNMSLSSSVKKSMEDLESSFCVGDLVEVKKGFLSQLKGTIVSINGKTISVMPSDANLKDIMTFQSDELRKYFVPGKHVKVTHGKHEGETGIVVAYDGQIVVVMSSMNVSQLKVQPRHLQLCNESNGGLMASGNFQIGDLLQIDPQTVGVVVKFEKNKMNVLTTANKIISLNTSGNLHKKNSNRACGLDSDNNEIRPKDTVSVIDGAHSSLQGEVKHIYKSFSFLFNRNSTENAGYIAVKNKLLSKKGRGMGGTNKSGGLFKVPQIVPQSPRLHDSSDHNSRSSNNDRPKFKTPNSLKNEKKFVGSTARIIKGPLKGSIGIIKEIKADTATIELHSMFKTVKVVKENFALVNNAGQIIDSHFGAQSVRVGGATGTGAGTSAWGGRTPNYAVQQTPMYGMGTATTPRHHGNDMTPRHDGGRTPHVNLGGQTPRFGMDGSETPRAHAFDPAGATPAHHAFDLFDDERNGPMGGSGMHSAGGLSNAGDQTPLSALSNSILDSPTVSGIYSQMNQGPNSDMDKRFQESPGSMHLFSPMTNMPRTPSAPTNFNIFTPATPGASSTCSDIPGDEHKVDSTPGGSTHGENTPSVHSMHSSQNLQRIPIEHMIKHVIVLARMSNDELKRGLIHAVNGDIVNIRLPDEKRVTSIPSTDVFRVEIETGNTVIHFGADSSTKIGQCLTIDNDEVVVKIRSDAEPLEMLALSNLEPYEDN